MTEDSGGGGLWAVCGGRQKSLNSESCEIRLPAKARGTGCGDTEVAAYT
jgi:hypothetical protein